MKIRSLSGVSTLNVLPVIAFVAVTFTGLIKCDAQSVVGKWKGISVKNYYSAEYAKIRGKNMEEMTAKEIGNSTIEYKADHTFILTFSSINNPTVTTMKGAWSMAQDQLTLTLEPQYNPRKTTTAATFNIHGNILETTAIIPPPSRIIKTVSTATRI